MVSLKEALEKLDSENENHWTSDGLPKIETVKLFMGGSDISRSEITKQFPDFNRNTAVDSDVVIESDLQQEIKADILALEDIKSLANGIKSDSLTLDESEELLKKLRVQLEELQQSINQLQEVKTIVVKAEDNLILYSDALKPKYNSQVAISDYLKSQDLKRQSTIDLVNELIEKGVDPKQAAQLVTANTINNRQRHGKYKPRPFLNTGRLS